MKQFLLGAAVISVSFIAISVGWGAVQAYRHRTNNVLAKTVMDYLDEVNLAINSGRTGFYTDIAPAFFDPRTCTNGSARFEDAFDSSSLRGAAVFDHVGELGLYRLAKDVHVSVITKTQELAVVRIAGGDAHYEQRMVKVGQNAWFFVCH
jgi:hypothetical protein